MKTPEPSLSPTREVPTKSLPHCRCGHLESGNWQSRPEQQWLVRHGGVEEKQPAEPRTGPPEENLVEYECLACKRRYRLRDTKLYEVTPEGTERPSMRQGRYGRWLSCK